MIYPAIDKYIDLAIEALNNGEIIVYPTDTLYGFGVDATNTEAIKKLNRLKGRYQPLSIIISDIDHIYEYAISNNEIDLELNKLFPGPYTAILPGKTNNLSPLVQNGSPNIGIRIPKHSFPIQIVKLLEKPIITTSINRHGNEPLNNVTQVEIDFPNVDIFEDSNHMQSKGSTIIDFSIVPNKIIRQGEGPYPL